jgi:glycosyltransferase involved in cell wall biosynthesis
LINLYRQSDLLVMPSLRDSFGFVFLEAMIQGVPCIGTNINAMPEIIEDAKTGYIVPVRDPRCAGEGHSELLRSEK